jgi:hypothetical protein
LLTCLKDYTLNKENWKLVIKTINLPPPPRFQQKGKSDKLKGFSGNIFVNYIDPSSEEPSEKEAFNILNKLLQFNQKVSNDFLDDKTKEIDPSMRITMMRILISSNLNGKISILKGSYYGMPDTKRSPAFALYEDSLKKLMAAVGFKP